MSPAQLSDLAAACAGQFIGLDALSSEQPQVPNWLQEQRP